ncbi:MAG: TraB/GumN family protein [Saprospiraceae bacterium]|nr:TraB/GumN family protein [Saprospiraceae bacterium]MDW8484848.1 TraB/GumN family protein [Saprospiraceae bacterium]
MRRIGALGLLLICATVGACVFSSRATYSSESLVPSEKALLWSVKGKGLRQPSYVLGTIHLIPKEQFQLSDAIRRVLREVNQVVFEIDLNEVMNGVGLLKVMPRAFMNGGQTLRNLLSEEEYVFVREVMSKHSAIPMSMMERMKPLFVGSLLESQRVEQGDNNLLTSVEVELYRLARKYRLAVGGLETIEYEIGLFDSIPYALQARLLVEQLRQQNAPKEEFAQMVTLYQQKDVQAMEAVVRQTLGKDSLVQEILVYRRNRSWIPTMVQKMHRQPTLFAVGAGHLGGPQGVIALLRQAGYRVEAVD